MFSCKLCTLFFSGISLTIFSLITIPITQQTLAQTASELRSLKAAKLPVILPDYVPRGFRKTKFESQIRPESYGVKPASYEVVYQGPNKCYFRYEACNTCGWGDMLDIRQEWVINSRLLGRINLLHINEGSNMKTLISWVFGDEQKEQDRGGELFKLPKNQLAPTYNIWFKFDCGDKLFSPQEATKIIHSLKIR